MKRISIIFCIVVSLGMNSQAQQKNVKKSDSRAEVLPAKSVAGLAPFIDASPTITIDAASPNTEMQSPGKPAELSTGQYKPDVGGMSQNMTPKSIKNTGVGKGGVEAPKAAGQK